MALHSGGDGDGLKRGSKPPINHVSIVAQQALPVTLSERGEGTVTLLIDDFNGELRVMVQAWMADDFGSSESKAIVAAPVIAELNIPRFLAGDDTSQLTLDATSLTDKLQILNIKLTTNGLLELTEQDPAPLNLAPDVRTTLFIPVRVREGFGDGEIQAEINGLTLPGGTLSAQHKRWKIGVRPVPLAQAVNNGVALQLGATWQLPGEELTNFSPAVTQGQLLLSDKPPLNLVCHIRELGAYPYGCLEQTTNGLFPFLYTNTTQLKALGIVGDSDEKRRTTVDTGVSRLVQIQRDGSGSMLRDKNGSEEYWLTAYVMDFPARANEQDHSVPIEIIDRGNERLLRHLQDPGTLSIRYTNDSSASRSAVQAYAVLVLARQ